MCCFRYKKREGPARWKWMECFLAIYPSFFRTATHIAPLQPIAHHLNFSRMFLGENDLFAPSVFYSKIVFFSCIEHQESDSDLPSPLQIKKETLDVLYFLYLLIEQIFIFYFNMIDLCLWHIQLEENFWFKVDSGKGFFFPNKYQCRPETLSKFEILTPLCIRVFLTSLL